MVRGPTHSAALGLDLPTSTPDPSQFTVPPTLTKDRVILGQQGGGAVVLTGGSVSR